VQTCREWALSVAGQPAATMDTCPVMLVPEARVTGEKPRSPVELYDVLRTCWSTATGSKWLPSNPAQGQCSVTALVVQDVLGGDILKTDVDGAWHFYNRIDGRRWDLTISQFDKPIGYDDLPSHRDDALSDTTWERYQLLRRRVLGEAK
jgi:hypothetical protein